MQKYTEFDLFAVYVLWISLCDCSRLCSAITALYC
uniref:Uncharacterized protein n=1 Tax=Anguilla anguilla TaxID=7936 RepID=A0A0E9QVR6_ANGAN